MATREELLILARLKNEASRPLKEIHRDVDTLTDRLSRAERVTAAETRELRQLGREAKGAQREMRDLARQVTDVGQRMTTFVSLPIAAGIAYSVRAASDLAEAGSKVDVVFGQAGQSVHSFTNDSRRNLLLSRRAALDAAGSFGALLTPMGATQDLAARMSVTLTGLSSDLSSFYNADVETALTALRSGLVGESEPLRRFGVQLSAARIESVAFATGIAQAGEELTPLQKALATYEIILRDTAVAQGDAERTLDGAANSMRRAQKNIDDAAASLGEDLLPAVAAGAGAVADLAAAFAELPQPAKTAILILLGFAAVAGPIVFVTGKVLALRAALIAAQMAGTGAAGSLLAIGRAAPYVAAAAAAAGAVWNAWGNNERMLNDSAMAQLRDLDLTTVSGLETGIQRMRAIERELRSRDTGSRWDPTNWANKISTDMAADAAGRVTGQLERQLEAAQAVGDSIEELGNESNSTFRPAALAADDLASALGEVESAADRARLAYDEFVGRFATAEQQRLNQRDAINQFLEQITASRQADGSPVTADQQLAFALQQLDQAFAIAEAEQRAGQLSEGEYPALVRQRDLISEIVDRIPMLSDEFQPFIDDLDAGIARLERLAELGQAVGFIGPLARRHPVNPAFPASFVGPVGPNSVPAGDTARPMSMAASGGSTLAAWAAIDGMVPGRRSISSFIRTWGLGSPDSDHHPSRAAAVDVVGSNLPATIAMVRRLGGFAEMHGSGPARHAHVVPPPVPVAAGGGDSILVDARGATDEAAVERAGYRGVERALRERERRRQERERRSR